jgi:hypothetical protein
MLLGGCGPSDNPTTAKPAIPKQPVRATLLLDHVTLYPGRTGTVGIRLDMVPGWKTYWSNPGASGLATTVKVSVPDDWDVGPVLWPFPKRFDQFGEIGYGYENQVLLMVEITPPRGMPIGSGTRVSVDVTWLACGTTCIPGSAHLESDLDVGYATPSQFVPEFEKWRRRIPMTERPFKQTVRTPAQSNASWSARLDWPERVYDVEFFPNTPSGLTFEPLNVAHADRTTTIEYIPKFLGKGRLPSGPTVEGLLVYKTSDGQQYGAVAKLPIADENEPVPPSPF